MNPTTRFLLAAAIPLIATGCASTTAFRHKDQTVTVSKRGAFNSTPMNYWIAGVPAGQVTTSDNLAVYRKRLARGQGAAPLKCAGFVDTRESGRIEVQLAEKHASGWEPAQVNGRHKLIDENAPKPFYHWLIP